MYSNVFIKELECLIEPGKVKDQLEVSQPKQFKVRLSQGALIAGEPCPLTSPDVLAG